MKDYLACLSIVRFSYFPTLQIELFCWAKLSFFATQGRFMGLQHSLGTTIAAVIGKAVVDLKLWRSSESSSSHTIIAMAGDRLHDLMIS